MLTSYYKIFLLFHSTFLCEYVSIFLAKTGELLIALPRRGSKIRRKFKNTPETPLIHPALIFPFRKSKLNRISATNRFFITRRLYVLLKSFLPPFFFHFTLPLFFHPFFPLFPPFFTLWDDPGNITREGNCKR